MKELLCDKHFTPVESEDEADVSVAVISSEGSRWYSVFSDLFYFNTQEDFKEYADTLSLKLETDILGISCFDSDYLFLNLINVQKNTDAWAGIGRSAGLGIKKRNNLSAWKNSVDDFASFSKFVREKYCCAEDVLKDIEHCIHLPHINAEASYEYLNEYDLKGAVAYLHFKLTDEESKSEAPELKFYMSSSLPFGIDKPCWVTFLNVGGASKGVSVYFIGPYVEHDEISFSDVCFYQKYGKKRIPIELQKIQLPDGCWAYYHNEPHFRLPPKVDDRLPPKKRQNLEFEREFAVCFVPRGNPRKVLDISVVIVPDKNIDGQTGFNVWQWHESEKEYIEHYNKSLENIPNHEHMLLRDEDFDLD